MLVAHDLAARRGSALLWQRLSFTVDAGAALVVRGANGAGKTTLLRILAGLTRAEHGEVLWRGKRCAPFDPALRDEALFVGHAPALRDELSAHENLASLAALAGMRSDARTVAGALDAVGLASRARLSTRALSQGQRRRVHLALLAWSTHALWILDEPGTALDADGASWLAQRLREQLARGGLAVLATHDRVDLAPARVSELVL